MLSTSYAARYKELCDTSRHLVMAALSAKTKPRLFCLGRKFIRIFVVLHQYGFEPTLHGIPVRFSRLEDTVLLMSTQI